MNEMQVLIQKICRDFGKLFAREYVPSHARISENGRPVLVISERDYSAILERFVNRMPDDIADTFWLINDAYPDAFADAIQDEILRLTKEYLEIV